MALALLAAVLLDAADEVLESVAVFATVGPVADSVLAVTGVLAAVSVFATVVPVADI